MREVAAIKQNKQIFSIISVLIFAFWLMAFSLFSPGETAASARAALSLCARSVIPSLAVFVICAKILIKTGFCEKLARTPMARLCPLLGMSCGGFVAFLIGLVSGFPMGAVALSELVLRGDITKEEAESLMPFCNNAGPAFVVGTVGASFFGSAGFGAVLFAAQTAAAITAVLLTAKKRRGMLLSEKSERSREAAKEKLSAARVVSSSVSEGAAALLSVCGFVVFFCVLSDSLLALFSALKWNIGELGGALLRGFFEISGGFAALGGVHDVSAPVMLALSGAMLGFGGISVYMQAADRAGAASLSMARYLSGKLLCALFCAAYTVVFSAFMGHVAAAVAIGAAAFAVLLGAAVMGFVKNKGFFKKGVEK